MISRNPSNNSIIGEIKASSPEEISAAVERARQASHVWGGTSLSDRCRLLQEIRDQFDKEKETLAQLLSREMGKPITQAKDELSGGISYFDWYLRHAENFLEPKITFEDKVSIHKVFHEPLGVVAAIIPWNYPFTIFIWAMVQNVIVGNTVVLKHSEECPMLCKKLEGLINKTKLLKGVFEVVYGDGETGRFLSEQNIDAIYFTGSSEVGRELYQTAAKKFIRVMLELGGSAPGIVFEDADLDRVLPAIFSNRFDNTGQACDALKRLIVHESKHDETVEKLSQLIASKKIGDPLDPETDIGPLVNEQQLKRLEDQVQDAVSKGAHVVIGGKRPDHLSGFYYLPTLLTNLTKDTKVWKEEVFGPVLPVMTFATEAEAIALANDTMYGLGGYLFTEDQEKAKRVARQMKTGSVAINTQSYWKCENPFGGYKASGMGRELGKFGLHDLTQIKVVAFERP